MANPELKNYIAKAKSSGFTDQQIKDELLKAGWPAADIERVFTIGNGTLTLKKSLRAVLAVIFLAVIAGVFWYADRQLGWDIFSKKKITKSTPEQSVLPSLIPSSTLASPTPNGPTVKDCGTIDLNQVFAQTTTQNVEKLTACLDNAIVNCLPATGQLKGTNSSVMSIAGREDEVCLISNMSSELPPKGSFEYYTACKFPIDDYIKPLKVALEEKGSAALLFMSLSFIKGINGAVANADGWYPNKVELSGKIINYECR